MSRSFYVRADSKKQVNAMLANGERVRSLHHTPFASEVVHSDEWQAGDTIRIYSKMVDGSPYTKSYGRVVRKGDTIKAV